MQTPETRVKKFTHFTSDTVNFRDAFAWKDISKKSPMKSQIRIGTSGWNYQHWKGIFYPEELRQDEHFSHYAEHFNTVELNNPFYRLPASATFDKWRRQSPDNFLFSVKASRFITHMKKLKDPQVSTLEFFERIPRLKEKLGPVLFQLPPSWKINTQRLEEFLSALPKSFRYVFEVRNVTWYETDIYDLLKKYNCAFCIYELNRHQSPIMITADFVYVRLHGPGSKYQGSYTKSSLKKWAYKISEWSSQKKDVFVYFDNDLLAYAALNALSLKNILEENAIL